MLMILIKACPSCIAAMGLVLALAGCAHKANRQATAQQQAAYLAGQNSMLKQQLAQQQQQTSFPSVTVLGNVQNSTVPWVVGLTLVQAIATANYLDSKDPTSITITRQGNSFSVDPNDLLNGTVVTLEVGDVVEIQ